MLPVGYKNLEFHLQHQSRLRPKTGITQGVG